MRETSPSYRRLIAPGISEEDKTELLTKLSADRMREGGKLMEGEKEKTRTQLRICRLINDETNLLLTKYGLPKFDVPPQNIHIFGENLKIETGEIGGGFSPSRQRIILREGKSHLSFADYAAHEMIHFKSFGALQIPDDDSEEQHIDFSYRGGFSATDREGKIEFFYLIDEALTEELAKIIIEKQKRTRNPLFVREIENTEAVMRTNQGKMGSDNEPFAEDLIWAHFLGTKNSDGSPQAYEERYDYRRPRKALSKIIDKLLQKNQHLFQNRPEILEMFFQGKITGNIMPLGRLIEKTFGKGTFRRIGEASSRKNKTAAAPRDTISKFESLIDSL